jgi:hypothetical protein
VEVNVRVEDAVLPAPTLCDDGAAVIVKSGIGGAALTIRVKDCVWVILPSVADTVNCMPVVAGVLVEV